ncbi:DUF1569 domain-containing protein [Microscilla marina]|uniref:DUF1569 domain-containing protein n=1 Tax=Microscilla marina ATCC 23134 TaxID=313606 RepID=A1ZRJ1_MICM2|nr:DUF1569 domain-containing protein [Microscilla marina]EAY27081.1 conserved hypothetical protein [Microscilla marina ATCC 23134]
MKEDLFNYDTYTTCLARLDQLNANTRPLWGKMSAAQMLAHCAAVQETTNGAPLKKKTSLLLKVLKPMIKKMVVKGEYKHGEKTHPAYVQNSPKNFEQEKTRLLNALRVFYEMGPVKAEAIPHEFFGKMTAAEKGRAMFKHLEHHLQQFGV